MLIDYITHFRIFQGENKKSMPVSDGPAREGPVRPYSIYEGMSSASADTAIGSKPSESAIQSCSGVSSSVWMTFFSGRRVFCLSPETSFLRMCISFAMTKVYTEKRDALCMTVDSHYEFM